MSLQSLPFQAPVKPVDIDKEERTEKLTPPGQDIEPFSLLAAGDVREKVRSKAASLCGVETSQVQDAFPCTPLQEGLLGLTARKTGYYVARHVVELRASADQKSFLDAWSSVVASTPILRTRIVDFGDQGLIQVILHEPIKWTTGDHLDEYIEADKRLEMGLGTPLARYGLIDDRQRKKLFLVWTVHHSLYDICSVPILMDRVVKAYHGESLPPTPSFQAFIKYITGIDKSCAKRLWQEHLAGLEAQPFPALPAITYQPTADETISRVITDLQWPTNEITASTIIRTAWSVLVAEYSGINEALFGVTAVGRRIDVPGIDELTGPTMTTIPVRVALDECATVAQLLRRVQEQEMELTTAEQIGLQRIRQISDETARACQFQTLLDVHVQKQPVDTARGPFEPSSAALVSAADIPADAPLFSVYALKIQCLPEKNGLDCLMTFDSKILSVAQMQRITHQFEHILRQLCTPENATKQLKKIDLIGQRDLEVIWSWNKTLPDSVEACIHDLISERARQQPEELAVHAWDGQLSYEELDQLSTRLAYYLVNLGVNRGIIVPLYFEKSKWTSVAIQGVIKAGGACVTMDSTQPEAYLRRVVQQTSGTIILSSLANKASAGQLVGKNVPVVVPEAVFSLPETIRTTCLPVVSPSDKLYVVFTSGSTGIPKGVIITHANFSSAIFYQRDALCITKSSRVFDFVSYAFDVSWLNALLTLAVGACLCVPSEKERKGDIPTLIRKLNINYADLTPSMTRLIDPSDVPSLDHLTFGGEEVLASDISRWSALKEVVNGYGPAECTPKSNIYNYSSPGASKLANNIGYGEGLNSWVVKRDNNDKLALFGTIGELWLEGPLVGGGYLNETQKTAAAFIRDPPWLAQGIPSQPGHPNIPRHPGRKGRLYKTGDLVRYNEDGSLTYIQRKDEQIKIRGQRVELTDIEYHIREVLADSETSVVAEIVTPKGSDTKMLIVFLTVPGTSDEVSQIMLGIFTRQIAEQLKDRVPTYMIPSACIPIIRIPMTPTGKADRQRLREIGNSMTLEELAALNPSRGEWRAPTTPMEKRLQVLWASTLKIDVASIGLDDSFLQIGGDSIAAMRLVGAARKEGLILTITDVFGLPTLHDLAMVVSEAVENLDSEQHNIEHFSLLSINDAPELIRSKAAALCGVQTVQVQDAFPCTPLQEGMLALTARRKGDYVPQFVFTLRDSVKSMKSFRDVWNSVVATTPILRTRIVDLAGQGLIQVVLEKSVQWTTGNSLDKYLAIDREQDTGLGTPLIRYGLIDDRQSNQRFFVWTIHHALYDGWSMPLIIERVQAAWLGETPSPPPPFQMFVKHIADIDRVHAERLWQEHLNGIEAQPFPALPAAAYQPSANEKITFSIDQLQWSSSNITVSIIIRAALSILIMQYTDANEALLGVTTIGRQADMPGIGELTGPTMATIPIRISQNKEATILQFLQRIQQQALEMTAVEQVGLQKIRRISADTERACQFQTLLVVQPKDQEIEAADGPFEKSAVDPTPSGKADVGEVFNTYALMVECSLDDKAISCEIAFDPQVLTAAQVGRMGHQLEHIIRQLCAHENATKRLADVNFVGTQDLKTIWSWNATLPETMETCVHDIIAETTRRQPAAPAICAWDGNLSYKELDQISTRLAHYLTTLGVGKGVIVPLCFEKSMWTSVAILGVMKAGGTSVTLDSTLPEERLRSLALQVSSTLILASANNEHLAGKLESKKIVVVGKAHLEKLSQCAKGEPLPAVDPSDTLYAVFTSGSTGTPKGALITHRNICSAIKHQSRLLGDSALLRVYNFASYSFDVSWYDVLRTLTAGGCLCVPSESDRMDDISGSFERLRANSLSIPPSAARLIEPTAVPGLKQLVMGGEPVTVADVTRWGGGSTDVLTVYGPAECVPLITMTRCDITSAIPPTLGYGRGANMWLVDPTDHNKLSVVGAVAEALIEGPLVGAGYLGNKELTEQVFVKDPTWLVQGGLGRGGRRGRLYKTGDLMRYGDDGSLVFIGRKDAQVKINSQRVELSEIEQHIRKAMKTDRDIQLVSEVIKPSDGKRAVLVTFVSFLGSSCASQDNLTELLEMTTGWNGRLVKMIPAYMIPSAYVPLANIPMTATGKTDRRKLREIGSLLTLEELAALNTTHTERRIPITSTEQRLQTLWASILGIDVAIIGLDDSFLQLGGDSVAAMRLVGAAREHGLSLTVVDIFSQPVLYDLATVVGEIEIGNSEEDIEPFSLLTISDTELVNKVAALCGVQNAQVKDAFPCTPLQEGLLALTAQRPGDYVSRDILPLRDSVDYNSFQDAWNNVVENTPILRTRIVDIAGQGLTQVILDISVEWSISDDLDKYIEADEMQETGLNTPLVRYGLIDDCQRNQRFFVWTIHHALYDGWSIPLIMKRLNKAYLGNALSPSPPFQAFVKHIAHINTDRAEGFWRQYLEGLEARPFPALPTMEYRPRADTLISYSVRGLQWPLSNITTSTYIRAAWSILVAQYTGATEVVFGATVIGRQVPLPRIEQIIGPTINTVPVRVVIDGNQGLGELLNQIQRQSVEMMAAEQLGLQKICQMTIDSKRACQFQTLLVVQPTAQDAAKDNELLFSPWEESSQDVNAGNAFNSYGLQLLCNLTEDGPQFNFSFDSHLIKPFQIERMGQQLEHVLRQVCVLENATKSLAHIETVSKGDLGDMWTWNKNVADTVETCVHDIIAKTIRRQPAAPAICAWDGELSYKELDYQSTQLAHHLVFLGVGKDVIVPLCFEKSMWMPVAQLAVMKAGGASVGMDTSQPEERLRAIVDQTKPIVILCSSSKRETASQLSEHASILVVDRLNIDHLDDPTAPRLQLPTINPLDMLYVVFTSGSTGTPKGAIITHRNFSSAIRHQNSSLRIKPTSRVYDFVSYAFDVTWSNLLHTLSAGACLCIPSEDERRSRIVESMRSLRVNYAHLTPTIARLIDPSTIPELQTVQLSGEALLKADRAQWTPYVTLINTYGPAECSVTSTCEKMVQGSEDLPRIGRGVGVNTWVIRTDGTEGLVPIGGVGELVLEGPTVGSGYLYDSEKTAAAFIENPPWLLRGGPDTPGRTGRLYKTGDLVRCDPDGGLTFIGRDGMQVKIRGQRVELGDIEHHIGQSLADNAMTQIIADVITPQHSSNPILIAFIKTGKTDETESQTVLRSMIVGLAERLAKVVPVYMIPSAYVPLASIPISATGKTDRRRLRELGSSKTLEELARFNPARGERRVPTTLAEHRLQTLWASILGITAISIGVDDSFLQIGGDSVAAMRLVGVAREQGLSLTVMDVFREPKLCDLAKLVSETRAEESEQHIEPFSLLTINDGVEVIRSKAASLCCVQSAQIQDAFPCTPLQEGFLALTARRSGEWVARNVLALHSSVNCNSFQDSWNSVVETTPILRTRIVDLAGRLSQVIIAESVKWTLGDNLDEYLKVDQKLEMGLGTPLVRYGLIDDRKRKQRFFVWSIHHALYDGWSIPLIIERAQMVYHGEPLPPSPPFQAFVKHIAAIDKGQAEAFWREYLEGLEAGPFPALPTVDYKPQANEVLEHEIKDLYWSRSNITTSTTIRAAWAILIAEFIGTSEALFGVATIGRQANVPGIAKLTGPTIASIPIRVSIDQTVSAEQFMDRVQREAIDMTAVEQVGLQRIRRVSDDTERACQFQMLLDIHSKAQDTTPRGPFEPSSSTDTFTEAAYVSAGSFNIHILKVLCKPGKNGLKCSLTFDSKVLGICQTQRMAYQFEHVLRQLCVPENATKCLSEIDFISQQDLENIWTWNETVPEKIETCVHDLITETAQRQPDAPAVHAWDGDLSYKELDQLSTRLAYYLVGLGISRNTTVPLCFEKSKWTSVAIQGIIKAGGACVTMDSTQPTAHLRRVVQQTSGTVILSSVANRELAGQLSAENVPVVVPESVLSLPVSSLPVSALTATLPVVSPSDKLYVVFTSGSTGTPKGVIITHSNFSSAIFYQRKVLGMKPSSRVYDFVSYAFDVSWLNALFTLTVGACLCIPSEADRQGNIAASIRQLGVNYADLTPSITRMIDPADVPLLQHLNFGGEEVLTADVARWSMLEDVINTYGPAECTPKSTMHNYIRGTSKLANNIGYGEGLNVWVVKPDNNNELSLLGSIGELWLEGPLVGGGYLGEAEKTAATFIENPSWLVRGTPSRPGRQGRLYKTGDLVRYNEDGSLVYIQRKDEQIKIRGQRVELADIEYHIREVLDNSSEISVVAEIVMPKGGDQKMLIVFLTMPGTSQEASHATRCMVEQLKERVPAYMIPSSCVSIARIPMTATGKTDRRKLREIGNAMTLEELAALNPTRRGDRRVPTTATEQGLQTLWASILGIDSTTIGLDDSFLQVGGDSITAMRLVGAAHEQGLYLTVMDVFRQPALYDLALIIDKAEAKNATKEKLTEPDAGVETSIILPYLTEEEVVSQLQNIGTRPSDVLPVTSFQRMCIQGALSSPKTWWDYRYLDLPQATDIGKVVLSCRAIWRQFDILRTVFVGSQGRYYQVVPQDSEPTVVIHDTVVMTDQDFTRMCETDEAAPAVLGTSFARFFITRTSHGSIRLTFRLSHAQYDDVSYRVILESFRAAFDGQETPDSPQFRDFVKYGIKHGAESFQHWQSVLRGSNMTKIPSSLISANNGIGTEVTRIIPIPTSSDSVTPATIFIAACACALAKVAKTSDVAFGRVVSGRSALDHSMQQAVGACVGFVPVRVKFDRMPSMKEAQAAVQAQFIEGLSHETIGFGSAAGEISDTEELALTHFGCQVHYQNGEAHPAEPIGQSSCRMEFYQRRDIHVDADVNRVDIMARPIGQNLEISVTSGSHERFELENLLQQVCAAMVWN